MINPCRLGGFLFVSRCASYVDLRGWVKMPGSRRRTRQLSNFTLTRTFSSGPKLAAFELT